MSSPAPPATEAGQPKAVKKAANFARDCVVLTTPAPLGPVFAAGISLGSQLSRIRARLVRSNAAHSDPWIGFLLRFPLPEKQIANEEAGFGVRHKIDPRQFPPTVMTGISEVDSDHKLRNRLCQDGTISPLAFLQASGLPVYRLRMQLRMAEGLFDWVANEQYPEVNFTYAPSCAVDRPEFEDGRALERMFLERFPAMRPSPPGKLLPVFVHCENSHVYVDQRSGSKMCRMQVQVGLDIAVDLVARGIDPRHIAVLSPYSANVELIGRRRRQPQYMALAAMAPASTVDAFQGQENDIIIVVMGTAFPRPGPGFTADANRLNVLLTRQRCGLVVVGDVNIRKQVEGGDKDKDKADVKGRGKGKGKQRDPNFLVISSTGEKHYLRAPMLQHIYRNMVEHGRVGVWPGWVPGPEGAKRVRRSDV